MVPGGILEVSLNVPRKEVKSQYRMVFIGLTTEKQIINPISIWTALDHAVFMKRTTNEGGIHHEETKKAT